MPLKALWQREPLARYPGRALIVRGKAYHRLYASLEKYLRKRTRGRSLVISGNRGVGKTTMVFAAIEDLQHLAAEEHETRFAKGRLTAGTGSALDICRPVLVLLSGPDVLRELARPPILTPSGKPEDPQAAPPPPALPSHVADSDNLLRQIARALHVSLAREFAEQFEKNVAPAGSNPDLIEAWAQLNLELNAGARVQVLRRFWDLAGRFDNGVLFKNGPERDRQGPRELLVLEASADAYRIAIGSVIENDEHVRTDEKSPKDVSWANELKALGAPVFGLVGGVASGFGVFHLFDDGVMRVLTSVGVALVSTVVLTFGLAPKVTITNQATRKFSPDTSVGSLTWRLRGIVDRMFQAGLAPVFVIDELDKSVDEDLGNWIAERAKQLKSFLTEQAFFCFVTGRHFAEKLHVERTRRTYPPSYTQFSDYLFVNYVPLDLHRYLRELYVHEQKSPAGSQQSQMESLQEAVLPFIVLFRAEMHPIDIRRELNSMISGDDVLALFTGESLPRVDSFALHFQIVIESVLVREDIEARMRDDARFALLALDAVYYPSRQWRQGVPLDISDSKIDAYLQKRRERDDAGGNSPDLEALPAADQKLLRDCARQVALGVQDPQRSRRALKEPWLRERLTRPDANPADSAEVIDQRATQLDAALPITIDLLQPLDDSGRIFQWRYDFHGLELTSESDLELARGLVLQFDELAALNATLSRRYHFDFRQIETQFRLMKDSTQWSTASQLCGQLRALTGIGHESLHGATQLREYIAVARSSLRALVYATLLARWLAPTQDLDESLTMISVALQLDRLSSSERLARIERAWRGLYAVGVVPEGMPPQESLIPPDLEPSKVPDVVDRVLAHTPSAISSTVARETYWDGWLERFKERLLALPPRYEPGWSEVDWALARRGAETTLDHAWRTGSASAWTEIAILASRAEKGSDGVQYPVWCSPWALAFLGDEAAAARTGRTENATKISVLSQRQNRGTRQLVVVVAAAPTDLGTHDWRASETCLGFVVPRRLLAEFQRWFVEYYREWIGAWLIVEARDGDPPVPPETLTDHASDGSWERMFEARRRVQLFAQPPKTQGLAERGLQALHAHSQPAYIVGARSIEACLRMAEENLQAP